MVIPGDLSTLCSRSQERSSDHPWLFFEMEAGLFQRSNAVLSLASDGSATTISHVCESHTIKAFPG